MTDSGVVRLSPAANLTEQVHDGLLMAIVSGQLAPGRLYSVKELAEQFGVSRTPVREAMLQLARRGMVEIVRNQGVRILQRTRDDLEAIFELRLWVEVPAVRKAAALITGEDLARVEESYQRMLREAQAGNGQQMEREDRAFHLTLLELSGNLRAAHLVDELRDFVLAQGQTTSGRSRSLLDIVTEHRPIIDALESQDPAAAAAAMQAHIEHTRDHLLSQLRAAENSGT